MLTLSLRAKTVPSDLGILPRGLDPNPEMAWKPAPINPQFLLLPTILQIPIFNHSLNTGEERNHSNKIRLVNGNYSLDGSKSRINTSILPHLLIN
jgi:hypothetical protein